MTTSKTDPSMIVKISFFFRKCIFLFHFYGTWHSHLTKKKRGRETMERKKMLTTVNYKQIKRKKNCFHLFLIKLSNKPKKKHLAQKKKEIYVKLFNRCYLILTRTM